MDLRSPCGASPTVVTAISMAGVERQAELLAAADKDDTAALTAQYLCQFEATKHTSSLVSSSSSYLDVPHEAPAAQWVVSEVE